MNLHLPTLIYHIEKKIVVEIFKIPHIILTFKKNKGLIFAMEKHWSCTVNFWPFLTMVTHTHQIGLGLYYVLSIPIRCRSNARWFQLGLSANLTLWNSMALLGWLFVHLALQACCHRQSAHCVQLKSNWVVPCEKLSWEAAHLDVSHMIPILQLFPHFWPFDG